VHNAASSASQVIKSEPYFEKGGLMSATLTVHNMPTELHSWLQGQASSNHRSIDSEVIELLDAIRNKQSTKPKISADRLMQIAAQCAAAPDLDTRSPEAMIGYDDSGLLDNHGC
jgi:plasmid stability protein